MNDEWKILVRRQHTGTATWTERTQRFEQVIGQMAERREDDRPATPADEVIEVVVKRRSLIHSRVAVEDVGHLHPAEDGDAS